MIATALGLTGPTSSMYRTQIICVLLVIGLALLLPGHARELQPIKVADNVYVFIGDPGEPSIENAGNTGNSGFIVGVKFSLMLLPYSAWFSP